MNKIIRIFLLAVLLVSAGCQRKHLEDPHEHYNLIIKAHFDSLGRAQLLSNKSDYAAPGTPATTKYALYNSFTKKLAYSGSFKGLQGGLYAQEGLYDLLVYTSDFNELDANFFRGMDNYSTAETYTRQSSIDQQSRNDVVEMNMVEPDPTFAVLQQEVVVINGYEDNFVEVEFVQKSFKYYLTIRARGLQNIHTAKMNISGMYTTAFLASDEHRMNESGTQTVDLEIRRQPTPEDIGKGELYGEFWSFGPNQREDIENSIVLYFVNGDVIVMKLNDLTPQIKKLTKGGEIIVEEELEIKGPAGGFQPGVGDWNDTNVDLIM